MFKRLTVYLQYLLPQHALSRWMGCLAESKISWIKNTFIRYFMKHYPVDLSEACIQQYDAYACFNDFFIRRLKPDARPITQDEDVVVSPADGTIAEIGQIQKKQLLQAKNQYFDLSTLLAGDATLTQQFDDGAFATIYLAPHNYHRVHMPITGTLIESIYVPGKLFSVNRMTTDMIPHLYARNERLIAIFDTAFGKVAVILVGAMIVGSMQTAWMSHPTRAKQIRREIPNTTIRLIKGEELGFFKMGSTVILLFEKNQVKWQPHHHPSVTIRVGEALGEKLRLF